MKTLLSILKGPRSLRNKLFAVLLSSTLIPLALIGTISYYTIYSVLEHKIEDGIRSNLSQTKQSLETSLNHLKYVSQQLSLDGSVGQNLSIYLATTDLYEKKLRRDEVVDELNLISFSNPSLGMVCYYMPQERKVLFANYCPASGLDLAGLPVFDDYSDSLGFAYYGPHGSLNSLNGKPVLSIAREAGLDNKSLYIYIETEGVQSIFGDSGDGGGGGFGDGASLLIVDHNGIVTYSRSESFPVGSRYAAQRSGSGDYLFPDASSQGWSIVSVIPRADYNREINEWLLRFFVLGISSLGVSVLFAWAVWRTVYRPLRSLSREIALISRSHFLSPLKFTDVKEFDFLLLRFQDMRMRIRELLHEVKEKEKRKAALEVEKLMHQINPHFTHNTLDTIRWLARMEGHDEIDRLVSTLNKVLYYNLGKGKTATIGDELGALANYVTLQQIRYNFKFDVRIDTDPAVRDAHIPRFILQPLVENALYHGGMADDGVIQVTIGRETDGRIGIRVTDNGTGMDEEAVQRLLLGPDERDGDERSPRGKAGLGIGIRYVRRMIDVQFGGRADFRIDSEIGFGTTIRILFPFE
ncbi:sensor histidine kinase [Paenibacillus humicola]|uniref:sensor histidine kinase n=1 Tax=Paenibacillus humicola TaxID=3110540 RepID=UPI00237BF258|nr:sensor histidine kinase [Paenibacillus humicola]